MSNTYRMPYSLRHGLAGWSRRSLFVFSTLFLLIGNLTLPAEATSRQVVWSVNPVIDGTVTDTDWNRIGDTVGDGPGSVVVGFNDYVLGGGEHRGVYQFDLRSAPPLGHRDHVLLYLNTVGTFSSQQPDNRFRLYAGVGTGVLSTGDFSAGHFVTAFKASDQGPTLGWYDDVIDVTRVVRQLGHKHAAYVVFVIRPNPKARAEVGAVLFSSNEISGDPSGQFVPAKLTIERKP